MAQQQNQPKDFNNQKNMGENQTGHSRSGSQEVPSRTSDQNAGTRTTDREQNRSSSTGSAPSQNR